MNELFAIIGGDTRQIALAARLARSGARVQCYGLPEMVQDPQIYAAPTWQEAIKGASVLLLPLPASPDGVRINMPLCQGAETPVFAQMLNVLDEKTLVIGGKFTPAMRDLAAAQGKEVIDYCKEEQFQLQNAIPTAEGALCILMERLPCTINGLSVAVTGFGRIARALARLLVAMGAEVTVGARKESALAEAARMGCRTVKLCGDESMITLTRDKAAVFNTVPHWIFTRPVLMQLPRETLLIDLASAPGGVDTEVARALGRSVIWALSLPGKYAPTTAGEIIADTVLDILAREGVV